MKKRFLKRLSEIKSVELALVLAGVHTLASLAYSGAFFEMGGEYEILKRNELLISVLFFGMMFLVYWGLLWLLKNRAKYKNCIRFGLAYFCVLLLLLALVWPGVWRNDDMGTAVYASGYILDGWQHAMTSVFYMLSYRLLPFFSGVIVLQCAVISVVTAYLYDRLVRFTKVKKIPGKILLMLPFFLPPVLDSALYPLRPILYGYLLILLIVLMLEYVEKKKINRVGLAFLVALFVICGSWRSEGVYLLVVACGFFGYLIWKHRMRVGLAAASLVMIVAGVFAVKGFENSVIDGYHQRLYKVSGTVEVATPLVRAASADEASTENELAMIDRVLNVELILNDTQKTGEQIFWTEGGVRKDFTNEEYKHYLKAVIKLAWRYPGEFIKNRAFDFAKTSALIENHSNTIHNTTAFYDEGASGPWLKGFLEASGEAGKHPWNEKIRKAVIRILEGRDLHAYYNTTFTYPIFWNLIIPLIGIIVAGVWLLSKRKIMAGMILLSILIKTGIVFVTAPGSYHMYYLAEYILGYICLSVLIVALFNKKRSKR